MLYELWRQTVEQHPDQWALRELASGRSWTFQELDDAARQADETRGPIRYPQGEGIDFLLTLIDGWRRGQVLCPLDPGQSIPPLAGIPEDCVHLKTTSATTGKPRVVAFTASQLVADVDNITATMKLRPDWPNLGVISLAHSYGFSSLVLPLVLRGIPLILANTGLPEVVRQAAEQFGPITLPAVPALWQTWHQAGSITRGIRLAISAGAPLPRSLELEVHESAGVKIHNFYGASECGGIAYDATEQPRREFTCVGRPMHGVEVSIADGGCLSVRSKAVGQGYWPEPEDNLGHGHYLSNDFAELRGDEIHLLGRASDVINVAGRKVLPEIIERALSDHPEVTTCLVFGAPARDSRGEIIVALIAARGTPDPAELRRFLSARLPAWQVPRDWCAVAGLDANERGKISRAEWRRRYLLRDGRITGLG